MGKYPIKKLAISGTIAALYIALTFVSFPVSFGAVQFRLSEILNILSTVTPLAIPGITVGCLISNTASFSPLDIVFGTLATLVSVFLSYRFRNIKLCGLPMLSAFMPILFNGVIVGLEICIYSDTLTFLGFIVAALSVALGETVMMAVGLLAYKPISKPDFKKFICGENNEKI